LIAIAEDDLVSILQTLQRIFVGEVVPIAMGDRDFQDLPFATTGSEQRTGVFDSQIDILADKLERVVAKQDAREQTGFNKNLKAVADADTTPPLFAKRTTSFIIGENRASAPQRR